MPPPKVLGRNLVTRRVAWPNQLEGFLFLQKLKDDGISRIKSAAFVTVWIMERMELSSGVDGCP